MDRLLSGLIDPVVFLWRILADGGRRGGGRRTLLCQGVRGGIQHRRCGGRTFSSITVPELLDIMRRKGLKVEIFHVGDRLMIRWMIGGLKSTVIVSENGENMVFRFGVTKTAATVSAEGHNRWNSDYRHSCSFADSGGNPILAIELVLAGGVSEGRIVDFIDSCHKIVEEWVDEILVLA